MPYLSPTPEEAMLRAASFPMTSDLHRGPVELLNHCIHYNYICEDCDELNVERDYFADDFSICMYCDHDNGDNPPSMRSSYEYGCPCWEDDTEYLKDCINNAISRQPDHDSWTHVLIRGYNIGWRYLSGWRSMTIEEFLDEPWSAMSVNTEWTQRWQIIDGVLTCTQSHHDAPMGESYFIEFLDHDPEDDDEDTLDTDTEERHAA